MRREVRHSHGGSIDKIPPGLSGRFLETKPTQVAIQRESWGRALAWMTVPERPVHKQNVQSSVVIVVEQNDAAREAFGHPLLAKGTGCVHKVDTG